MGLGIHCDRGQKISPHNVLVSVKYMHRDHPPPVFILNYVIPLTKRSWYAPLSSQCMHSITLACKTLWSHLN